MKNRKIIINTNENKYPILIGKNLSFKLGSILSKNSITPSKILFIIDNKVPKKIISKITKSIKKKYQILYFNSNEKNKCQKSINKIIDMLLKNNFNRNDCLISIGGGITGDTAGYAASIFKRGMVYINIPSTLLAQVDASIGGKTGINTKYGKNLIGSFYQPALVISDTNFLKSLPKREILCGYGEIFKHSIIFDRKFFLFLDKNLDKILNLQTPYIENSILKSCIIKKKIVEKDFKEKNLRKTLNLGHTFGHAYEACLGYSRKLNHGEAVILGIASATAFSYLNKLLNFSNYKLILNHISKISKNLKVKKYFNIKSKNKILKYMVNDKKNFDKNINLVLINDIGKVNFKNKYALSKINKFLTHQLKSI